MLVTNASYAEIRDRSLTRIRRLSDLLFAVRKQEKLESRRDVRFDITLGSIATIALLSIEARIDIAERIGAQLQAAFAVLGFGLRHWIARRVVRSEDLGLASCSEMMRVELDGGGAVAWDTDRCGRGCSGTGALGLLDAGDHGAFLAHHSYFRCWARD